MAMRIDYARVAPEGLKAMLATNRYLDTCSLDQRTRRLTEILISKINGCGYCIWSHQSQARDLGVSVTKIEQVSNWRVSGLFTDAERAAFEWAEAATGVANGSDAPSDTVFDKLKDHFDDSQIVDLTMACANMNALNRLAISFRHEAPV